MTERSDLPVHDSTVPVIPYDTFEAANLFLATGRTPEQWRPFFDARPDLSGWWWHQVTGVSA
jgi:hypothetical protein